MAEPQKQQMGDGSDNIGQAAGQAAKAAKNAGKQAAKQAAKKGAEAAANAAAATVKAGVEGGKAVAEIAAGTAAGGPWGAIISAAWAMRHTLFKILVCLCLSVVFLIVMIVELPGIIINKALGIDGNEPTVFIAEIYENLSETVSDIVHAGYDASMAEVERLISDGGYDRELSMNALINYAQNSAGYDTAYILSAYSTSVEQLSNDPEDMLTKRLGAEVDYIVKGIDPKSGIAAASRLEAMRARRKEMYFGTDRDGNNRIYAGVCAEARVVSAIRAGIFIDLFGVESYIPLKELSYQRWMDAAAHFQPGQRILVKVLDVDRSDRDHVRVSASVKQAGENPYEKALRRYSVGNRYVGTVSMVDVNGVFVALDGGIDCLCSYPKRGRPPRGARVTVRILGINHETNRIWGAITHIAMPH